ncbi:MAG: MATE family efflux transporter [Lachnospiraceae bacterium]|nr:MATE family efflux transporter [Lachnospiraceae bacterium]
MESVTDNLNEGRTKELLGKIMVVALPAVVESFFIALIGMIDSLMVSRLGTEAVAAVGLTVQPKFICICVFFAVNMAVSAVVARRRGEKNQKSATEVFLAGFVFSLIAGIVISIVAFVFASPFVRLFGSQSDTHDMAVEYFRIIIGGQIFNILTMSVNAALRGAGNTKIAMKTNLLANSVNVVLNYLLINGNLGFPKLGIKGAAIATVIGTFVGMIMSFASLFKKDQFINIYYVIENKIKPTREAAKSIVKISGATFTEQIFLRIGFSLSSIIAANLGTNDFAVHNVAMNVMSLSFSFGDGMGVAAVALIGKSLGEKNAPLAKRYGKLCHMVGIVIASVLALVYFFGGSFYFSLYFKESELIEIGAKIMRLMIIVVFLQITQVMYLGCLRGAGDVKFVTVTSVISVTILRPIFSFILAYSAGFGIFGIWIGILMDQFARYLLASTRFASGKWTRFKV